MKPDSPIQHPVDLCYSNRQIVGQCLKKRLYFHPPEVPAASAMVTLEELAYPVCIERAPALLDTQFFEYLKVPRWPAGIWVEGGDMPASELLDIIHIELIGYPTVGSCASVLFKSCPRGVSGVSCCIARTNIVECV